MSPIRRTISSFDTAPRDGTPFHTLHVVRFNPLLERFEVLAHHDHGDDRIWCPVNYRSEPTMWLRLVPLPFEVPEGHWFSDVTISCHVRPRGFFRRLIHRLFGTSDVARTALLMRYVDGAWKCLPASGIAARSDETPAEVAQPEARARPDAQPGGPS